jgi:hypothetical protein
MYENSKDASNSFDVSYEIQGVFKVKKKNLHQGISPVSST